MLATLEIEIDDIDEMDFEFDMDAEPDISARASSYTGEFKEDVQTLAKTYIAQFFKDKEMHCGGKIPTKQLFTKQTISLVLNSSVEEAIVISYYALEQGNMCEAPPEGQLGEDVKLVLSILDQISGNRVPKEFAGGLLLLYIYFCEGYDIFESRFTTNSW